MLGAIGTGERTAVHMLQQETPPIIPIQACKKQQLKSPVHKHNPVLAAKLSQATRVGAQTQLQRRKVAMKAWLPELGGWGWSLTACP